jgi:CubicO group peptidase (beta-lactamase class C family)
VRNGYLIFEEYYYGYEVDKAHEIRSASKSFMSALVGIALDKGFIISLDEKMLDFFPEFQTPDLDSRKYQITIKHLLQMRSGLTNDDGYTESENWIKYTTELNIRANPGEQWNYATSGTHLLSGIITKATGKSSLDFAEKYLFEPLNISIANWTKDPQDYYSGGNHMVFTPRNMAKFGLLYLNNGKFNGKQIISSLWMTDTLHPYSKTGWGWNDDFVEDGYGYLWYVGNMNNYQVYFALGHGGQFMLIVANLNIVIVTTAEWWLMDGPAWSQTQAILNVITNILLSAFVNE